MQLPMLVLVTASVLVLLAAAAALIRLRGWQRATPTVAGTYEAVPALLTPAERSFFGVLHQAVASNYQIFAKVRLADIVRPVRNQSRSGWQSAFNRIAGKHVDFVFCGASQLNVVAVIELDDQTHKRFDREDRDILVDSALADAGIPVLRVCARQSYSLIWIQEQMQNLLGSN